jgi:NADH:ubiquinone oxidoreductase subunit 4 (subunit M)
VLSLVAYKDLNRKEGALFMILIFALFLMGIYSFVFLDTMLVDSINVLEHAKGGRVK